MVATTYELEIHRRVYDNRDGSLVMIKPDGDGLGLIEVVQGDQRIVLAREQAYLVAEAITSTADELNGRDAPSPALSGEE